MKNIVDLPNYKGHCYAIAALMPLLIDKDFCEEVIATPFNNTKKFVYDLNFAFKELFSCYVKASTEI